MSADETHLMLMNQYDHVEMWNLKTKVREQVIEIKSLWNTIAVSYEPGHIYFQLDQGIITKYNPYKQEVDGVF